MLAAFALAGRWIQLYPERVVPKGQFIGTDSRGARLYRIQIAVLGTCIVFGGTWFAISSLFLLSSGSALVVWIGHLMGIVAGIFAAAHVRREAKARPPHVSNSPYGWWP